MEKIILQGVEITLTEPVTPSAKWIDYNNYQVQLKAAWLRLSDSEPPLNPRLIGAPGIGKTTLASAVGQQLGQDVYIFQCTTDTRPEDLLITPVLSGERKVEYRASAVVTAMIRGGLLVLDEGNRMPERSWATLAPLMDHRRTIDSAIAAIRVHAHPDFRLCVTMNDDSSVYELPGYIQSRLKPKIDMFAPPWEVQANILRSQCPEVDDDLIRLVLKEIIQLSGTQTPLSNRDVLTLAHYAQKLRSIGFDNAFEQARLQVLSNELNDEDDF